MQRLTAKVKRLMIVIIGACIPTREARRRVRRFLRDSQLADVVTAVRFQRQRVSPQTALIIEVNPCHGETLPGYTDYFRRLDYAVDLLVHADIASENPFVRMKDCAVRIFASKPTGFSLFLSPAALERYACIFLATSRYYDHAKGDPAVTDKFPWILNHRNLICVEHDLVDVTRHPEDALLRSNRVVTLGRFTRGTRVNPHVFGQISITPKASPLRFLVVGTTGMNRGGADLARALPEVLQVAPTVEVVILGQDASAVPDALRSQVKIRGRVNFATLFSEVEQADFILALLDHADPLHARYLTTRVSGSIQLSYGFRKPLVIQRRFADPYGFTPTTAVVYEQDLATAMLAAIRMPQADYAAMQAALGRMADALHKESLQNLRQMTGGVRR